MGDDGDAMPLLDRFRPAAERPSARARWQYALQAVCFDLRERRRSWTWEAIAQRRRDKLQYIELFKAALARRALSADEQALVDARMAARRAKQWGEADRLRAELASRGVLVKDSKDGQEISFS